MAEIEKIHHTTDTITTTDKITTTDHIITDHKITDDEMDKITGGKGSSSGTSGEWTKVKCNVEKNYLALRSAPEFKRENEIDEITRGKTFFVKYSKRDHEYVWAFYNNKEGWVNSNFIKKA